jgi:hypothetical protein
VLALAGIGAGGDRGGAEVARPVVVRIAIPLPAGTGQGHASFVRTVGDTRWTMAAVTSGEEHPRFSLVLVSEPVGG